MAWDNGLALLRTDVERLTGYKPATRLQSWQSVGRRTVGFAVQVTRPVILIGDFDR